MPRLPLIWPLAVVVAAVAPLSSLAAPIEQVESSAILLRADLPRDKAANLHLQLGQLCDRLAEYWDAPLLGQVRCNVVADLKNWPTPFAPDVEQQLKARAGTTITERRSIDGKVVSTQSTVNAVADGRTPQHELTHAYCWQTLGRVGPDWYAEGMAELFADWQPNVKGVAAPSFVIRYLRTDPAPPTPQAIIANDLGERKPWQIYAHRWALCYLLANHPSYAERFKTFGRQLLSGKSVEFEKEFTVQMQDIARDYSRFLQTVEPGFQFPAAED